MAARHPRRRGSQSAQGGAAGRHQARHARPGSGRGGSSTPRGKRVREDPGDVVDEVLAGAQRPVQSASLVGAFGQGPPEFARPVPGVRPGHAVARGQPGLEQHPGPAGRSGPCRCRTARGRCRCRCRWSASCWLARCRRSAGHRGHLALVVGGRDRSAGSGQTQSPRRRDVRLRNAPGSSSTRASRRPYAHRP